MASSRRSLPRAPSEPTQALALQLWREASTAELPRALAHAGALLASLIRVRGLVVARLEAPADAGGGGRFEPVAIWGDVPDHLRRPLALSRRALSSARREAVRAFVGAADPERPLGVAPGRRPSAVVVLPLPQSEALLYVVGQEELGAETLERLVEPIDATVANDRRMHELRRLREATEAENRALLSRLHRGSIVDGLVGEEGGLRMVMERVAQVAATDVPVLLFGETGSGKEVVARAIHERSPRHAGPMVRVNCGAIPPQLVDSSLFGHERGSFTGATETRRGWFERADGGTLLLDEIGELPLDAQVRLLRVLQEGSIERVGGQRALRVDVRVVAATHRDLYAMVRDGRFREDLWYRLSVFPLVIPPLRDRLEDLPALATQFASRAGLRLGAAPLTPTATDLALLRAYDWPGNVRELAAVIDRAVILGHGRRLEVAAALGAGVAARGPASAPASAPGRSRAREALRLDDVVAAHVREVLGRTRGRIEGKGGAAELLGVNPGTLRAKLRKLGVVWSEFRGDGLP
ncbi:MAG: sigma-54-dependent Fis family transcriptional regulator [Myxococcales bacterium]|nr:sigma-54-dependent Fis family transcriptional regulator [Myxococcales bacterium]